MKTIVALETRYQRTPDGRVWSNGASDYSFWKRYLDVFTQVRVIARVADVQRVPEHARQADGPGVEWVPIPYFVGPWQFARRYLKLRRALRSALDPADAVILRVPGTLGTCVHKLLRKSGQPYGVEVVGNPHDVFAPGGVRSVLRPFMRRWYPRHLRRQCAGACAAAYVTATVLQQQYPPAPDAHITAYSSIELGDEAFVRAPRRISSAPRPARLLLIGALEQLYKGPDVLIDAVAANVARGLDLHLTIVGDGKHRPELEQLARSRRIADRVRFTGRLPAGDAVRTELDRADLFVLPSRTEGLPRVLIEALARGLPCLGSNIGGIPELLEPDELVPPGDAKMLERKISTLLADTRRLTRLSARNLQKARDYHADTLRTRRRAFYAAVQNATEAWQQLTGVLDRKA